MRRRRRRRRSCLLARQEPAKEARLVRARYYRRPTRRQGEGPAVRPKERLLEVHRSSQRSHKDDRSPGASAQRDAVRQLKQSVARAEVVLGNIRVLRLQTLKTTGHDVGRLRGSEGSGSRSKMNPIAKNLSRPSPPSPTMGWLMPNKPV